MLPLVAVLMFVLVGFAALTTDLGLAAVQQSRLEVAAEAAALASFREDARQRYALAMGATTGCGSEADAPAIAACIDAATKAAGEAVARRVMAQPPNDASTVDVAMGPTAVRSELVVCAPAPCREWRAVQAVPLLFGQGSAIGFQGSDWLAMMERRDEGSLLDPDAAPTVGSLRERGVPVGGVARVASRPVVRVGPSPPSPPTGPGEPGEPPALPGRAPFALDALSFAEWFAGGGTRTFVLDDVEGRAIVDPEAGFAAGGIVAAAGGVALTEPLRVGAAYYVPLLVDDVVVGFGLARVVGVGPLGTDVTLRRLALSNRTVAPGNASASLRLLDGAQLAALPTGLDARVAGVLVRSGVLR